MKVYLMIAGILFVDLILSVAYIAVGHMERNLHEKSIKQDEGMDNGGSGESGYNYGAEK